MEIKEKKDRDLKFIFKPGMPIVKDLIHQIGWGGNLTKQEKQGIPDLKEYNYEVY